jgi:hypothetical protein
MSQNDGGSHHGGGEQGERIEGSLTDGGSIPGDGPENRSFGAGRGLGAQDGAAGETDTSSDADQPDPGPSGEKSGYGNTPPR